MDKKKFIETKILNAQIELTQGNFRKSIGFLIEAIEELINDS